MKRFAVLWILAVFILSGSSAFAREENLIQVQMQFYKLSGNLSGKTFEDDEIWTTGKTPKKYKDTVTVFNRADFTIGDNKFEFKNGICLWNEQEVPISSPDNSKMPREQLQYIDSTEIVALEHKSGSVKIEAKQPVQYFEKRDDGFFELKQVELSAGMDIEITNVSENKDKKIIELTDLVIKMRSVEKREIIKGVNLAVGKPVLSNQEFKVFFRLKAGKDYGMIIRPQNGQGGMLIRLRANSVLSGTYKPAETANPASKQP